MSWDEARAILGVSRDKMTKLIRSGTLTRYADPLDARRTQLLRAEVLALKAQSVKRTSASTGDTVR
jgi:hypothetical protein